jgi:exodeoxyribonuclease X
MIVRASIDPGAIVGQRHRAGFDAHAAALLLIALAEPYRDWTDLAAAAVPPGLPGGSDHAPQTDALW